MWWPSHAGNRNQTGKEFFSVNKKIKDLVLKYDGEWKDKKIKNRLLEKKVKIQISRRKKLTNKKYDENKPFVNLIFWLSVLEDCTFYFLLFNLFVLTFVLIFSAKVQLYPHSETSLFWSHRDKTIVLIMSPKLPPFQVKMKHIKSSCPLVMLHCARCRNTVTATNPALKSGRRGEQILQLSGVFIVTDSFQLVLLMVSIRPDKQKSIC